MPLTDDQLHIVTTIKNISASLGLAGASFIVFSYVYFGLYRHSDALPKLILFLSILDTGASLSFLIAGATGVEINTGCAIIGFLNNIFIVTAFFMTTAITTTLRRMVISPTHSLSEADVRHLEAAEITTQNSHHSSASTMKTDLITSTPSRVTPATKQFVICLTIGVVISCLPWIRNRFGPAGAWCWVRQLPHESHAARVLYRFVPYYLPLFITLTVNIWNVVQFARYMRKSSDSTKAQRLRRRLIRRVVAYPVIQSIICLWGLMNRLEEVIASPIFVLNCLEAAFLPSQGFWNGIVYGLNSRVKHLYSDAFSGCWNGLCALFRRSDRNSDSDSADMFNAMMRPTHSANPNRLLDSLVAADNHRSGSGNIPINVTRTNHSLHTGYSLYETGTTPSVHEPNSLPGGGYVEDGYATEGSSDHGDAEDLAGCDGEVSEEGEEGAAKVVTPASTISGERYKPFDYRS